VSHGVSLDDAIASAPKKDGGFSPLTFAWVLQNFDVQSMAEATDVPQAQRERLDRFRRDLIERLLADR